MQNDARDLARAPEAAVQEDWPRDYWRIALASSKLADTPAAVQVLDWRLAVFRDDAGEPRAVDRRCAHRGADLTLGEVTQGALACRYHGWRFGGDGRCVHIPSLLDGQEIPRGVGVRGFPCVETQGYVWVWMGDGPPAAGPAPLDDFNRFNWIQGSLNLECPAILAIENNLDWCHPVFAHPFTHGMHFLNKTVGFQEQAVEIRLTDDGLTAFAPPAPAAREAPDPLVALTFALPDRVTVTFATGPQGPMGIVMHLVPTGPKTCRQEWLVSTGGADPVAGPTLAWTDKPNAVFEQDRLVLESIAPAHGRDSPAAERSVEADTATLLARRVLALASAGRWEQVRDWLPQRRIIRVRT